MLVSVRLGADLPLPSHGKWWGARIAFLDSGSVQRLAVHGPGTPAGLAYRANAAAWRVSHATDGSGRKRGAVALTDSFAIAVMLVAAGVAALTAVMVTRSLGYNGVGLFAVSLAGWFAGAWLTERLMVARVDSILGDARTRFLTATTLAEETSLLSLAGALDDVERWNAAGGLTAEEWHECRLYAWRLADLPMLLSEYRRREVVAWLRAVCARAHARVEADPEPAAPAPSRWW